MPQVAAVMDLSTYLTTLGQIVTAVTLSLIHI